MSEREQLRLMVAVGAKKCREAANVCTMAEERYIAVALPLLAELEAARDELLYWTAGTEEAIRRFIALEPAESGIRVASWERADEDEDAA